MAGTPTEVLTRGLQTEPEQRFPSMDALRGWSRPRLALAAGALMLALAAVPTALHVQRDHKIAACTAAGGEIADAWNDEARASLEGALLASGKSYAATTFAKATPWIDRWTQAWAETRAQVCLEADVDETRSPALYEAAVACLGERRDELTALLAVLREDPGSAANRAVPAFAGLTPASSCTDRATLERRPPPPADAEARAQVAALRRDVARVQGMYAAGRWIDGLVDAEALLARAEAVGDAPRIVPTSALVGHLAVKNAKLELAERSLIRAYVEGSALGLDEIAAEAVSELVYVTGYAQARFEVGVQWSHAAEALIRRLGKADDMLGARLYNALAISHRIHGTYEESARLYERVLTIRERILGPDHPEVGMLLGNLANLIAARGDPDGAALDVYRRSLKILEEGLGAEHPVVANAFNNYGAALVERGKFDQALPLHRRALAIREAALGPNHAEVAGSLANLALIHVERHDFAGAEALGERVLAIREAVYPPDHPDIADALTNQANVRLRQGALDDALALEQRALGIRERNQSPEHPDVAYSLHNLGQIQQDRGDLAAAEPLFVRALAIREKTLAPNSREIAKSLMALGQHYVIRGDTARAAPLLERALQLDEKLYGSDDPEIATTIVVVGDLQQLRREFAAARASYTRALAIWTRHLGAASPKACPARIGLGELALAEGRPAEAIALLEPLETLCTMPLVQKYIRKAIESARRAPHAER
jgi:tetratricopeptide (TPR) repeat protein